MSVNRRLWGFLPLLLSLVVVGLLALSLGQDPDLIPSAKKGKPVPTFSLPSLIRQNKIVDNAIFKGHWTLLNVWATWCPTCHVEHRYLTKLAQRGVRIVGVDYKDDSTKARQWLADKGNPYVEVLIDQHGDFGLDLGVYGAPETYVINPEGKILLRHVGNMNEIAWQQEVLPLWKQPSAEPKEAQ